MKHTFTLILEAAPTEAQLEALREAGCGDATFGTADGVAYAEFEREGPMLMAAIGPAVEQLQSVEGVRVAQPKKKR